MNILDRVRLVISWNGDMSYCRFHSLTFHIFVCSIKYSLLTPIQLYYLELFVLYNANDHFYKNPTFINY